RPDPPARARLPRLEPRLQERLMLLDAVRREALPDLGTDPRQAAAAAPARAPAEPPARGIAVTVRDLHKSFDGNAVIEGLNLFLPAGGFTAVVGRSGCGKSTLLRLILGLDTPTGGRIDLEGPAASPRRSEPPKRIMF